jgi:hypothetical protein
MDCVTGVPLLLVHVWEQELGPLTQQAAVPFVKSSLNVVADGGGGGGGGRWAFAGFNCADSCALTTPLKRTLPQPQTIPNITHVCSNDAATEWVKNLCLGAR